MTFRELFEAVDAQFEFFRLNEEFEIKMKEQALKFISEFVEPDEIGIYSATYDMMLGYGDI